MQSWLALHGPQDCSTESEHLKWISSARKDVAVLLKPLAITAAKLWLTKEGYADEDYLDKSEFQVWFLRGYMDMADNGKISDDLSNFNSSRDFHFGDFEPSLIEGLAEWASLEKSTHWYTGVGWILYEAGYHGRALEFLGKAVSLVSFSPILLESHFNRQLKGRQCMGCYGSYRPSLWRADVRSPFRHKLDAESARHNAAKLQKHPNRCVFAAEYCGMENSIGRLFTRIRACQKVSRSSHVLPVIRACLISFTFAEHGIWSQTATSAFLGF